MKTVLVTGAGGFLGSHLSEKFLQEGYNVIAVDNFCTGSRSNREFLESLAVKKDQKLFFIEADVVQDWNSWLQAVPEVFQKSIQYVLHFASPASPPLYQQLNLETLAVNSTGLNKAMTFADTVGARVVFASTSEVYGVSSKDAQKEEDWGFVNSFSARSCYNESKRFGEALIYAHNQRLGTQHGLVRIFNTYGPRMNPADGRVIINFLVQAKKGEALTLYGDGTQTRSFCYVSDLVEGIYRYTLSTFIEPINIGNPAEITIKEVAEIIRNLFQKPGKDFVYSPISKEDPPRRKPDIQKAQDGLRWKPHVSLQDGLQHMQKWYLEQNP
ncbi:MAG: NAD-dependent epimerase/dehydratase family protein [Bdellovibrio sp.]